MLVFLVSPLFMRVSGVFSLDFLNVSFAPIHPYIRGKNPLCKLIIQLTQQPHPRTSSTFSPGKPRRWSEQTTPFSRSKLRKDVKKRGRVTVFRQIFRNFGFAELTLHSEIKRKANFPFVFRSFFRNFAA